MTIQLARTILETQDDDARLDLIYESEEAMVWNEHGDEVEQFNRIIAQYPGVPPASVETGDDAMRLTYKDMSVDVAYEYDREDNLRAVLALAGLTHDDLTFRMCVDTDGNSEFAFFLLPPDQWVELESELGVDAIRKCFMPVGASCDALFEALAESGEPLSPLEQAAQACAESVEACASHDASCSVSYALGEENGLVLHIDTDTDQERDLLIKSPALRSTLEDHAASLRDVGLVLEHARIESQETVERDWGGIGFDILYRVISAKLWFNRQSDPTREEDLQAHKLLQTLNADA